MPLPNLWLLLAPPIAGGIIGYFTNDLAIKMIFRPYRPIYIGQWRIPFTPGVIPHNQDRLAKRISNAIMGSLLTPEELQKLTRRLLKLERVQAAILWLLRLALDQVNSERDQKTVTILAGILRDLLSRSLPRLLRVLARRDDFLETELNQIFDRVLLEFQLNDSQSRQLANWLLTAVVPPNIMRQALVDFLTDRNIQIIDTGFRQKSSGTYWVVANLLGLRNALVRLRSFCLDEKEAANALIAELTVSLGIQERLQEWLHTLSLQNLPVSTVRQLRKTMRDSVRVYLQAEGADLLQGMGQSINWEHIATLILNRLRASEVMDTSLDLISLELARILEDHLERDLEQIVEQVIPILSLDQVIIDRVMATSPKDLEAAIQGIVKSELQAIVNLGGLLGFSIGTLQALLLLFQ